MSPLRAETITTKVIPLREDYNYATSHSSLATTLMGDILNNEGFQGDIKNLVEGTIAEHLAESLLGKEVIIDDPFDSIYLSDLTPDELNVNINRLKTLSKIEDLSDTISFNDGWDD